MDEPQSARSYAYVAAACCILNVIYIVWNYVLVGKVDKLTITWQDIVSLVSYIVLAVVLVLGKMKFVAAIPFGILAILRMIQFAQYLKLVSGKKYESTTFGIIEYVSYILVFLMCVGLVLVCTISSLRDRIHIPQPVFLIPGIVLFVSCLIEWVGYDVFSHLDREFSYIFYALLIILPIFFVMLWLRDWMREEYGEERDHHKNFEYGVYRGGKI